RLETRPKITVGVFLLYAFSPFPSNYLFMAYGLTGIKLSLIAAPFFIGRLVSYSGWAFGASTLVRLLPFDEDSSGSFFSVYFLITQAFPLFLVYLFTRIDWRAAFIDKRFRWRKKPAPEAQPSAAQRPNR